MYNYERLSDDIKIAVSSDHTFGTDAVLLSDFAKIKARDKALDMGTGCGIIPFLWLRNEKINNVTENKYLIPNLLAQTARVIDQNVQITSISNPYDKHIVIEAKSPKYRGLGFFKKSLSSNDILENVVAGGGIKQGDEITVTIEGDLP